MLIVTKDSLPVEKFFETSRSRKFAWTENYFIVRDHSGIANTANANHVLNASWSIISVFFERVLMKTLFWNREHDKLFESAIKGRMQSLQFLAVRCKSERMKYSFPQVFATESPLQLRRLVNQVAFAEWHHHDSRMDGNKRTCETERVSTLKRCTRQDNTLNRFGPSPVRNEPILRACTVQPVQAAEQTVDVRPNRSISGLAHVSGQWFHVQISSVLLFKSYSIGTRCKNIEKFMYLLPATASRPQCLSFARWSQR